MKKNVNLFLLTGLVIFASCTKKPDPVTENLNTGNVKVTVENMAGNQILALDNTWYKTENGDSIQITTYNYFISNIVLTKADGSTYKETESYHLIMENDSKSKTFTIPAVPVGKYTNISFLIGVDSARNVSGAQTGALDPNTGMFWDWNTGYIQAKMEAKSPQAKEGNLIYHLGGYSGEYNMLRTVLLKIDMNVDKTKTTNIHMKSDALEWFKTPNKISIKDLSIITIKTSAPIADNYMDMFSIDHID